MKPKAIQNAVFLSMVCIVGLILFKSAAALHAAPSPDSVPDVTVRISGLEDSLEVIDTLAAAGRKSEMRPSAMLKGMIHGTDWIDPTRCIVIGIDIKDPKPDMALLIPFKTPNPDFESAFQALARSDYYYLALPPGSGMPSKPLEAALAAAARSRPGVSVSAAVNIDTLLKKAEPKIQQALSVLQSMPPEQAPKDMPVSPDQLREMAENVIDTAKQFRTLEIRVDLSSETLSYEMGLSAHKGSEMADLFIKKEQVDRVAGYRPQHQMNFRSRAFEAEKILSVMEETFGRLYRNMGIDFSKLVEISTHFTGEMAGGMSVGKDGVALEMIHVLKEKKTASHFIEKTYLPWLMDFGETMRQAMEKQLQAPLEPLFIRTPDSTVAGRRVYGVRFRLPMPSGVPPSTDLLLFKALGNYEFRMTVVDGLLISASTDGQLEDLIQTAGELKPAPATGPLMTMEYDLSLYFKTLQEMLPEFQRQDLSLPALGKVKVLVDAGNGRAFFQSSVKTRDIQALIAYFKGGPPSEMPLAEGRDPEQAPGEPPGPASVPPPSEPPTAAALPLLKKGSLAALKGDNPSAVAYFSQAIAIAPDSSDAHFQLGVTLGEMRDYSEALDALNRAVSLDPENGRYRYARGRVYLLSGDRKKAMNDFKRAAELGNDDAKTYLEKSAAVQN